MKKVKEIVCIVIVTLITLSSCTTEAIGPVLMLKKIVEVSVDGSSSNTNLNYNGNKIVNIDKVDVLLEFYYTGDLITKIVEFNKLASHKNTLEYSYSDGKLTKIISSDGYVINYIHNNDGTISYEKRTKEAANLEVKIYHGVLSFQNGNLIKDDQILDNTGNGILSKKEISLGYDNTQNPLNNIVGFSKLLNYQQAISLNNSVVYVESSTVQLINDDQIISSIKRIDSKYQYNSNGYPTEIVSEKIIFGDTDSKHLKSQLFYN
ncbi:hypothetical protein [Flavobacterium franklandianum]|uniref:DUF4595 domain-containing protein n=1 Tax=Flavobacterium franklandianum TaxID=2594430 RepID=A0A553CJI0_9FLAO|nr:hypothetical protein [Flavobacterium franklandianum]TRX20649.1 hypothetical protein FNW17_11105 [Flavobacterium franklandianum]